MYFFYMIVLQCAFQKCVKKVMKVPHFKSLKGALSDFCQTMLIFESTKSNTSIAQQDLALYFEISAPHVRTLPWQRRLWKQVKMTHKHIQTKANTDKLCETKQNQHYSPIKKKQRNLGVRFETFPLLEFSPRLVPPLA